MFSFIQRILINTPALLVIVLAIISISTLAYVTPVIDRDEARYAQTSFQISETNDFLNLKFDDEPRLKKPPGIYWMQFTSYKVLSSFFDKEIWIFRIPSLLSFLLLLFYSHKLGRLLFYDLNTTIPLAAISGTLIVVYEAFQATTDMSYAAFALISYYYFIKIFNEDKFFLSIFFILSSLVAMIIKGPIFLIITLIIFINNLVDFNISIKKKILQISNISAVILISIILAIIYNVITNGQFFQESIVKDFGNKLISAQESHGGFFGYYLIGSVFIMYPIYPLFIIGVFFNVFKKMNWNKNLILLLSSSLSFLFLLELIPTKLPHYVLPIVPLICIYLSRTLEFVEFKWSKALLVLNVLVPIGIIFADFMSYQGLPFSEFQGTGEVRTVGSYIYYLLILLIIIINPLFYRNNHSLLSIIKVSTISSLFIIFFTLINLVILHEKIWISKGIKESIEQNYECKNDYNLNIEGIDEPSLYFEFYENFKSYSECSIKVTATNIDDVPINNISSFNKSFFNYSNGKKINLNFSKK